MDQRLVASLNLKNYVVASEDKHESHAIDYHKIHQISEQLATQAKLAIQSAYVGLEEMDRLCQIGEVLQKELYHVRSDLIRRKNLELLLPSPNTQHHLPCSSLLSPSSTPPSPTSQQSMSMSTGGASTSGNLISPSTTPNGSPSSPHGMGPLSNVDSSSMSITSTGVMQSDDYWRSRKIDPTKIVRRSPTPLYVNLTEQMILAQSSKRKRPAEGDLYCHNCKTKDTPEWRRGPMGAKTLCNACGIRWRLSQAEAQKQKKGDQSPPPSSNTLPQYPPHLLTPQPPPSPQPQQQPQQPITVQQSMLQQQQMRLHHHQQMQQMHQTQQQHQMLQQQYSQSHHQHQHPAQQHMVLPGHVGLAQENIPNRMGNLSGEGRGNTSSNVISSLMTPSPIAT